MKLFRSFMREEFKLAMNILFEAWDFFTDSYILFVKVVDAEEPCASKITDLVIPWLSCYAIATVVSIAALFIKAKMFRDQIRNRRKEFILDEEEQADRIAKLKKHTKRFVKTKRSIHSAYASMLVGLAECLPLGILQIIFSLRCGVPDAVSQISLVTTWLMLGMKLVKCTELTSMWKYRKKQRKKVSLLTSLNAAAQDGPDARVIQDTAKTPGLTTRPRPESVELSDRPTI